MRGDVTDAGRTNNEQLKIELLSQWKLEAESRNLFLVNSVIMAVLVLFPVDNSGGPS